MVKKLLLTTLAVVLTGLVSAQTMPNEKAVFTVSPNATSVKFSVRMTDQSGPLVCDFGEGIKTYTITDKTAITPIEYIFTTPSAEERTIEIATDQLLTLRVVNNKQINGLSSIHSTSLQSLNIDYVSLVSHNKIDVSQCPNLVTLTLTSTGVEEIVLPASSKLESVQASPTSLGQGTLKRVNLDAVPNLKEIGFTGASLDTLDVTGTPKLETLVCSLPTKVLRGIKGAKDLKFLKTLDVRGNALAFDQIPDRYITDEPLENFRYSTQGSYLVPKSKVKEFTVDLSSLYMSMGIATGKQPTDYVWKYKANANASYTEVPSNKILGAGGVFSFEKSLSDDDTLRVYCTMSNPGYPGIGKKGANTISTYMIKLTDTTTGITGMGTTADNAPFVSLTDNGCTIHSEVRQNAYIYNANGTQVWKGLLPASVTLGKGVFILRTENGHTRKFSR